MRINKPFSTGSIIVITASVLAIVLMRYDVMTNGKLGMNDGLAAFATLLLLISICTRIFTRLGEQRILIAVANAGIIGVCVVFFRLILIFWLYYAYKGATLPVTYYFGVVLNCILFFSSFKPFWNREVL
jgi:hypothetical protein